MAANANLYETVRLHLGTDPKAWIAGWRAAGLGYPDIARKLHEDHSVVVSRMTLTRWDRGGPTR